MSVTFHTAMLYSIQVVIYDALWIIDKLLHSDPPDQTGTSSAERRGSGARDCHVNGNGQKYLHVNGNFLPKTVDITAVALRLQEAVSMTTLFSRPQHINRPDTQDIIRQAVCYDGLMTSDTSDTYQIRLPVKDCFSERLRTSTLV